MPWSYFSNSPWPSLLLRFCMENYLIHNLGDRQQQVAIVVVLKIFSFFFLVFKVLLTRLTVSCDNGSLQTDLGSFNSEYTTVLLRSALVHGRESAAGVTNPSRQLRRGQPFRGFRQAHRFKCAHEKMATAKQPINAYCHLPPPCTTACVVVLRRQCSYSRPGYIENLLATIL